MAGAVDLRTTLEPVDFEFGGWCRRCLLPSGVRVTAAVTVGGSSTLRTFDRCTDCLCPDVDPPDKPDVDHL